MKKIVVISDILLIFLMCYWLFLEIASPEIMSKPINLFQGALISTRVPVIIIITLIFLLDIIERWRIYASSSSSTSSS
jgi:hypothetical protein